MKISRLTQLATASLLLIVIMLTASVVWSLHRLDIAFQTTAAYQSYSQTLRIQIQSPTFNYLRSGDATLLTQLSENIQAIEAQTRENLLLPEQIRSKAAGLLQSFYEDVLPQLRSAGKLSDPQALLINNERELSSELSWLNDYVSEATQANPADRQSYLRLALQMERTLVQLIHTRENYFKTRDAESRQTLTYLTEALHKDAQKLSELPLLGVYEPESNNEDSSDLSAMLGWDTDEESSKTDKGEEHISEINSLVRRYPKELSNAAKFLAQKQNTEKTVRERLNNIDVQVTKMEGIITAYYDEVKRDVYILLFICVALIMLTGGLMSAFKHRLASILSRTNDYINRLASGDLNSRFELNSNIHEVKSLKGSVDELQNYFQLLLKEIDQETQRLDKLQASMTQGAEQLEDIVKEQTQSSESAAVQMDQMTASFQEVAQHAAQTNSATQEAQKIAEAGHQSMLATSTSIDELSGDVEQTTQALLTLREDANQIEQVLKVIQGFAEQTNLLALNAAIEAARAGEAGKGFAVVADEVRNLASNTAKSAEQIKTITEKLNQATDSAVQSMQQQRITATESVEQSRQAQQAIEQIRNSIMHINDMSSQIASATEEQSAVSSELSTIINRNADSSRRSAAEAENNQQYALSLAGVSSGLNRLIAQFR